MNAVSLPHSYKKSRYTFYSLQMTDSTYVSTWKFIQNAGKGYIYFEKPSNCVMYNCSKAIAGLKQKQHLKN